MAKRSPWAAQSRKAVAQIRKKHREVPVSPIARDLAALFQSTPPARLTHVQRVEFLANHFKDLRGTLLGSDWKNSFRKIKTKEKFVKVFDGLDNPDEAISMLFDDFVGHIMGKEILRAQGLLQKQLKTYVLDRKLPFDAKLFKSACKDFFGERDNYLTKAGFKIAAFERTYISLLKQKRALAIRTRTIVNRLIKRALRGRKFTDKQKQTLFKWVSRNIDKLSSDIRQRDNFNGLKISDIAQLIRAREEELLERLETEVISTFRENTKVAWRHNTESVTGSGNLKKLGSREKRLRLYTERSKDAQVTETRSNGGQIEREDTIRRTKMAAELSGRTRDEVLEYLNLMTGKNNHARKNIHTGEVIGTLFHRGVLSRSSVSKLFAAGPLAQKRFVDAIEKANFVNEFGSRRINVLARGITSVGAKGKEDVHLIKEMNSRDAVDIVRFLVRRGLFEKHTGGRVIYLRRAGSDTGGHSGYNSHK